MFYWILAIIIFLILEVATVNLVTIFFAVGAVFGLLTSIFTDSITIQFLVFFLVSILALIATRPLVKKYLQPKFVKTNYDQVLGKVGVVTSIITPLELGEVKVDGKKWAAKANKIADGENIQVGEKVKILRIEGVKLIVEREE